MNDTDKILKKLREDYDVEELCSFNEFNVQDKLQENSWQVIRFRDLWLREKNKLNRLEDMLEEKNGERYHYYRFEMDENLGKPEIEKYYLPRDEEILRIKRVIRKQEVVVGFFETVYRSLEKMQWNMKNFSDNLKSGAI